MVRTMFRYYSLRGDIATPSGLYTSLCHAFVVFFIFFGPLGDQLFQDVLDQSSPNFKEW